MRRPSKLTTLLSSASALLLATSVRGGVVAPGETLSLNSSDFALPAGSFLAEKTSAFSIDYGGDTLNGTLYSAVYNVGGKLAFLYDVELDPANNGSAAERSQLTVAAFSSFATDVTGMLDHEEVIAATRSADGGTVSLMSDTPGLGGAPALLVQTDADSYNTQGSAVFYAGDELLTLNAAVGGSGSASFDGVLQPTLSGGNGQVPPPTAIPLPPAAFSALGVMIVMGLMFAMRRRLVAE